MPAWWQAWRTWSAVSPNRRIFAGALTIGVVTVGARLIALAKWSSFISTASDSYRPAAPIRPTQKAEAFFLL